MPIYDFQCLNEKCNHTFEVTHSIKESPKVKCEKCNSKTEKLISPPAIKFNGSGFYVNDYGKGKGK